MIRIASLNTRSVGEGGGVDCSTRTTARQHWDRSLAGDETHERNPHAIEFGLQGMGNGGGEPTPARDCHCLEGRGGIGC